MNVRYSEFVQKFSTPELHYIKKMLAGDRTAEESANEYKARVNYRHKVQVEIWNRVSSKVKSDTFERIGSAIESHRAKEKAERKAKRPKISGKSLGSRSAKPK